MKETLTPWLAIFGAFTGLLGTGIGLWNLWLNRKSHRLKIRVTADGKGGENEIVKQNGNELVVPRRRVLNIRVINDSYFPVTVVDVGFVVKEKWFGKRQFHPMRIGDWHDKREWRIEPRSRETFTKGVGERSTVENSQLHMLCVRKEFPTTDNIVGVYATVATGQRFTGGVRDLPHIFSEMKNCIAENKKSDD